MSPTNPSPRKAVIDFGVPMSQTIINSLGLVIAEGGTPWDAEDAIYAFRDHAQADRAAWVTLEDSLATRLDAEAALSLAEGLASGVQQGQPPTPTSGTESQVLSIWGVHANTRNELRARVRALSRTVASRVSPGAVLSAITSAVSSLDPA